MLMTEQQTFLRYLVILYAWHYMMAQVIAESQDFPTMTPTKCLSFNNSYHTKSQSQEQKKCGQQHDIEGSRGEEK